MNLFGVMLFNIPAMPPHHLQETYCYKTITLGSTEDCRCLSISNHEYGPEGLFTHFGVHVLRALVRVWVVSRLAARAHMIAHVESM